MSQSTLTRELALRIGLAARALPDTPPKLFISVLRACIGTALNDKNLAELGKAQFQQALNNFGIVANADSIRESLRILQNSEEPAPIADSCQTIASASSIRIAIGSDDPQLISGHFGSCRQFLIYQIAADDARLVDVRSIDSDAQRQHDDKNVYRAELIADCRVLYIASIGGPAAAKLIKYGIHPVKADQGEAITQIIKQLQIVLAHAPPPWLAKSMGIQPVQRVCFEQES
ncbi:nitrogen fixation protein NifX [Methylomonas sp. Kb3]|uniref:nitrogen fixation protein NifX n=1 Tax=Methylomonas sp. Kb3 TaxID=1611544 RepID=UPI000C32C1ED|nr:nitrogen fixation protein NifX [Methylomonas sp. Kb3]PKD38802.1 nitrogen fixation protein NifX [Methylomonas sp. Kb3]